MVRLSYRLPVFAFSVLLLTLPTGCDRNKGGDSTAPDADALAEQARKDREAAEARAIESNSEDFEELALLDTRVEQFASNDLPGVAAMSEAHTNYQTHAKEKRVSDKARDRALERSLAKAKPVLKGLPGRSKKTLKADLQAILDQRSDFEGILERLDAARGQLKDLRGEADTLIAGIEARVEEHGESPEPEVRTRLSDDGSRARISGRNFRKRQRELKKQLQATEDEARTLATSVGIALRELPAPAAPATPAAPADAPGDKAAKPADAGGDAKTKSADGSATSSEGKQAKPEAPKDAGKDSKPKSGSAS